MAKDQVYVSGNFQRLTSMLEGLGDKREIQKAVSRSIKRTLVTVRKVGASEIRARKFVQMTASQLKNKVKSYDEAKPSKSVSSQYGKIWIGSNPQSLGKFYARRVKAGKSHALMKQNKYGGWQGVQLFSVKLNSYGAPYLKNPGKAFLVTGSHSKTVFERMGDKRLPIKKQLGPGMAELVRQTNIMDRLRAVAAERYATQFKDNLDYYAHRAVAKGLAHK